MIENLPIDISDYWDGDEEITLKKLIEKATKLQKKYGKNAVIKLDAGYNNVSVLLTPSKKTKHE